MPDDVFRQMIEIDYFGTLHAVRAVAPGMVERGRGSVVAVSSAGLLVVFPPDVDTRSSPRRTGGSRRRPGGSAARSSPSRRRRSRRPLCRASTSGVS
ncbi:SDR family NAD(P)-dependent oxidoreductase [Streptomyces sp. NPDC012510]|uniref:SDR family NAD(P)-dependent oxidoreductase n=1 Tax=Streptomyces sp. NPDC012510 TaxID=3364838 RepID=UPI0036E3616D